MVWKIYLSIAHDSICWAIFQTSKSTVRVLVERTNAWIRIYSPYVGVTLIFPPSLFVTDWFSEFDFLYKFFNLPCALTFPQSLLSRSRALSLSLSPLLPKIFFRIFGCFSFSVEVAMCLKVVWVKYNAIMGKIDLFPFKKCRGFDFQSERAAWWSALCRVQTCCLLKGFLCFFSV